MNKNYNVVYGMLLLLSSLLIDAMVEPVKNSEGRIIAHKVELPLELHEKILDRVMASSSSLKESTRAVRAWAHVNRNFYDAANTRMITRRLVEYIYTHGSRDICYPSYPSYPWVLACLRTQDAGTCLVDFYAKTFGSAYDINESFITQIGFGDYRLALFAIDTMPVLRADECFLHAALSRLRLNRRVSDATRSAVAQRLIEAGADPSRLPDGHSVKVQFCSSHAQCSVQ